MCIINVSEYYSGVCLKKRRLKNRPAAITWTVPKVLSTFILQWNEGIHTKTEISGSIYTYLK